MYRFNIQDGKAVETFLSVNDIDYVDCFFQEKDVVLVTNSTEAFTQLKFPVLKSEDQKPYTCRISRNILKTVGTGDIIELINEGENIVLTVYSETKKKIYSCTFPVQVVAISTYVDKLELAAAQQNYYTFNTSELDALIKIAKRCNGVINVIDKVASVILKSGVRVYKRIQIPVNFTITCTAFANLRKCNSLVGSLRDYLIAVSSNLVVLARKSRLGSNQDFEVLTSGRYGSKYIADINLSGIFRFLNKTKVALTSLAIDVERQECQIEASEGVYSIPVFFSNIRHTDVPTEKINLPTDLLTKVICQFDTSDYNVQIKKNFVQLSTDEYIIVW